ncbi:MAG TPA: hypothetical protein GX530_07645 [Corynebacteriales bacterium]|nr:hypothetical protein [Mycobacteriales bacterium]
MLNFKTSGFDDLERNLEDLLERSKGLDGTQSVPIVELLSPSFVSKHTRFTNVEEMFKASGFSIETQEDFDAIPADERDEFIRSVSPFANWQAMMKEAIKLWTAEKLGF